MRGVIAVIFLVIGPLAQGQSYLWAPVPVPQGAWALLPGRAESLGIPTAQFSPETGGLVLGGAAREEDLLAGNAFLYLDGDSFLLGLREGEWTTVLRGKAGAGELVILGAGFPEGLSAFALLEALGLLPPGLDLALSPKEVPAKHPAPPEGVRLDPVLWALVGHPDWFGFARAEGIERVGLRVRAVAELSGCLSAAWEPFVRSATETLAELLLPIPLLPELAKDPAVRLVRPPHMPVPLGG